MDVLKRNNVNISGNPIADNTLMFGHGFGLDQTSFLQVTQHFEKDYRIILYDNVGGGHSDMNAFDPAKYSTLDGYVTDLGEIMARLNTGKVIFVGHSVNGMVGLIASLRYPEYFKNLILIGASPRYLNDAKTGYFGGFSQGDLDTLYHSMTTNYAEWVNNFSKVAMANPERPALAKMFASTLSQLNPSTAKFVAQAIFESDFRADLAKAKVPTLIIQTSRDIAVPEQVGEYLHNHIPNSSHVKIKTDGHFPQISGPDELALAIKNYLES